VIQAVYDNQEEIPEVFRELFTERNGKWECTGIAGMRTLADFERMQEGIKRERKEHDETKLKLRAWGDLKPEDVQAKLDRFDEMEAKLEAGHKPDDEKLNKLVETRLKSKLAPVERANAELVAKLADREGKIAEYQNRERQRQIHDEVRTARVKTKAREDAEEDILLNAERMFEVDADGKVVTKDGVGVTPGIGADLWLQEMQPKRQYWWPESQGGGAKGGRVGNGAGLNNPWSAQNWNLTEQGKYLKEHGMEKAEQLAKLAGSFVGATAPIKQQ
jgi:hypothetical protein